MKIDAVVIGNEHYNTLGLIRSVGEAGYRCHYIEIGNNGYYVKHSKYITSYYHCNEDLEIIHIIKQITMSSDGKCCVFPASDRIALLLDKHYQVFSECYNPNAEGKVGNYLEKSLMAQIAEKSELKVPKELVIDLKKDLNLVLKEWRIFPCILKPNVSLRGKKNHITIARNTKEFHNVCLSFIEKGYDEVLVQEFLDGEDKKTIEVIGCSVNGEILFQSTPFVKLREYPTINGSTSYAEFVPGYLNKYTSAIVKMLQYTRFSGLFDLEFIEVNGNLFFIEMNFRNGAPGYALTDAGVNLPKIWIEGMGKKVFFDTNIKLVGRLMAEHLDFLHVVKKEVSVKQWISEYRSCEHKMFFIKTDKKPMIYYIIKKIVGRLI